MRVTGQAKKATHQRILEASRQLFADRGFAATTTREIAAAAGIATGTLFNYFPAKEAIALHFLADALAQAHGQYEDRRRDDESLEEDLFAHVMSGLREMTSMRQYIGPVIDAALGPFVRGAANEQGEAIRLDHLETVATIIARHDRAERASAVTMHLYWTLYVGVLSFWAADESPNQEDTLVVLDQSMRLFVGSLAAEPQNAREVIDVVDVPENR